MKRIVVKVGSNVLTNDNGKLDVTRMSALVDQIAWLRGKGYQVILVTSGAVACGRNELKVTHELDSVEQRQLYSAVGQVKLINLYYQLFREYGLHIGQVLAMKENFDELNKILSIRGTISSEEYLIKLEELYITSKITSIPYWSLYNNNYLRILSIPFVGTGAEKGRGSVMGSLFYPEAANQQCYTGVQNYEGGSETFRFPKTLTKIIINTQTTIPTHSFMNMTNVEEILLPKAVTIGLLAFYNIKRLTTVDIAKVTTFGERVFEDCDSLKAITLPRITTIPNRTFYGCDNLVSVTIPDSVTSIGTYAFYSCIKLPSIVLPNSIASIGDYAFAECRELAAPILKNLTSIGNYAFQNCYSMKNLTIQNVKTIGNNAFEQCQNLEKVTISHTENATIVSASAFQNCSKLKQVSLGGVNNIGDYTFSNCAELRTVTNTDALLIIGKYAFNGCVQLTGVEFENVTNINDYAFNGCSNLLKITLPSVVSLSGTAFRGHTYLEELYITSTITSLPTNMLIDCLYIRKLVVPFVGTGATSGAGARMGSLFNTGTSIAEEDPRYVADGYLIPKTLREITIATQTAVLGSAFRNFSFLNTINLLETTSVGELAFYQCYRLKNVNMPKVTTMGTRVFEDSDGLVSIELPQLANIPERTFYNCDLLQDVVVPESVTTVYNYAFANCFKLKSIELPGVTTLGSYVFQNCYALNNVEVPSLVTIGSYAFQRCEGLRNISIPKVTTIGEYAFTECFTLRSIDDTNSLTKIDQYAFQNCYEFSCNNFATVTTLGQYVFQNCESLLELSFPALTSMHDYAFLATYNVEKFSLTSSIAATPYWFLRDFYRLRELTMPFTGRGDSDGQGAIMGSIFNTGAADVNYYQANQQYTGGSNNYRIPKTLRKITIVRQATIPSYAFQNMQFLNEVDLPKAASIGDITFLGCHNLELMNIPNVKTIGKRAFENCDRITSIALPSVQMIDERAFYDCNGLRSVEVPVKTTGINQYAFYNCTSLQSIELPSVTIIGNYAFQNCLQLKSVTANKLLTIGTYAFDGCRLLESVDANNVTTVGDYAFRENNRLKTINIAAATAVNQYAFQNCYALEAISLPNVQTIGAYAFSNCNYLRDMSDTSSLTTIGSYAFQNCFSLSEVNYESVTTIADWVWQNCYSLLEIKLPSVTSLNGNAFRGHQKLEVLEITSTITSLPSWFLQDCWYLRELNLPFAGNGSTGNNRDPRFGVLFNNGGNPGVNDPRYGAYTHWVDQWIYTYIPKTLETITINRQTTDYDYTFRDFRYVKTINLEEVTTIGYEAFNNCLNLTEINMPKVVTLGNYVFANCMSLTKLTLPEVSVIGDYDFQNCYNLQDIEIPNSVSKIGNWAFQHCRSLTDVIIPISVTTIGEGAFSGCYRLESLTLPIVGSSNTIESGNWTSSFGYIFGKNTYDNSYAAASYYTPSAATTFYIPRSLRNVIITNETTIPYGCFMGCFLIENIDLNLSAVDVKEQAFAYGNNVVNTAVNIYVPNKSLYQIMILNPRQYGLERPDQILDTKIIYNPVYDSKRVLIGYELAHVAFDDAEFYSVPSEFSGKPVLRLGKEVFKDMVQLREVVLPETIERIGEKAFLNCTSLETVTMTRDLREIANYAFAGCESLLDLEFPAKLKVIGDYAFDGCVSFTEIDLENTIVESIGKYAFNDNVNVTSITLPETIDSIGDYAFNNCNLVEEITIPEGATSIGEGVLARMSKLRKVSVPFVGHSAKYESDKEKRSANFGYIFGTTMFENSEATIQRNGFTNLNTAYYLPNSLEEVTISNAKSVPFGAFMNCKYVTSIDIEGEISEINDETFRNCASVTTIEIGSSVRNIGTDILKGCSSLVNLVVPFVGADANYETAGATTLGYFFGNYEFDNSVEVEQKINLGTTVSYFLPKSLRNVTVLGVEDTKSAVELPVGAFMNCKALETINLPEGLTTISNYSLYNVKVNDLSGLKFLTKVEDVVTIADGVKTLGAYSLMGLDKNATGLVVPNSVRVIGEGAFNGWGSVKSIDLPFVGERANIRNVLSKNDTTSKDYLVATNASNDDCSSSSYQETFAYIFGTLPFDGAISTSSLTVGGKKASSYVPGLLKSVNVTSEDMSILCAGAFMNCYQISSIALPEAIERVEDYALFNTGLVNLDNTNLSETVEGVTSIKDTIDYIGSYAFASDIENTALFVPDSVRFIGEGAFAKWSSLTSIDLPFSGSKEGGKLTDEEREFASIFGSKAFAGATGTPSTLFYYPKALKDVAIRSGDMYEVSFKGYTYIKNVSLGDNVVIYGNSTFEECYDLESVRLPLPLVTIGSSMMKKCSKLKAIDIGENVKTIGNEAFMDCVKLETVTFAEEGALKAIGDYSFYNTSIREEDSEFELPNGLETLGTHSFENSGTDISTVILPETVVIIGEASFGGWEAIHKMVVPFIGTNLNTSITYDEDKMISNSNNGQSVFARIFGKELKDGINYKADYKYVNDDGELEAEYAYVPYSLAEVVVLGGVVDYNAFANISTLQKVTLPSTAEQIGERAFEGCQLLSTVEGLDSLHIINTFAGCKNLKALPDMPAVTTFEREAFKNSGLVSIDLLSYETLTSIGKEAFANTCKDQVDLVLPTSINYVGKGAFSLGDTILDTDALVTNLANVPLLLFYADCTPVLLADPVTKCIGLAHAGWRGTVAKIVQKTVQAMMDNYGANPANIFAAIGPSIGACCYEVDDFVRDKANTYEEFFEPVTAKPGHYMLDLWGLNAKMLEEVGISKENISISGICTADNHELFCSYRAEKGVTGRMGVCLSIKE